MNCDRCGKPHRSFYNHINQDGTHCLLCIQCEYEVRKGKKHV